MGKDEWGIDKVPYNKKTGKTSWMDFPGMVNSIES